ncbi:MAG: TA system VapC family ribonuclease toxin [Verrucomicrobiota bacterium]
MILPDLNLLLYAYNPHAARHAKALEWWQGAVRGPELIGLPHEVLFGFVRIATNPRLGAATVSLTIARNAVESWLNLAHARLFLPGPDHWSQVMDLMKQSHSAGRVLSDAILATYAISNNATLYSNDSDFARFEGLKWENPI